MVHDKFHRFKTLFLNYQMYKLDWTKYNIWIHGWSGYTNQLVLLSEH